MAHFGETRRVVRHLLKEQLPAVFNKRYGTVKLDQPFSTIRYQTTYYTSVPSSISSSDLIGVALGIFIDYEVGYEHAQVFEPRCLGILAQQNVARIAGKVTGINYLGGHCSSFSNEDLPSDYLGFVASSKGLSFDQIINILGGGEQLDQQNPPDKYWGNYPDSLLCGIGICGDCPFNNQYTLKVYNQGTGHYVNQSWPSSLTIKPVGFGVYWGRSVSDFALPTIPVPPTSLPAQPLTTPMPPGLSTPQPPGAK